MIPDREEQAGAEVLTGVGRGRCGGSAAPLYWAGGIYDINAPLLASRYNVGHTEIPADRITASTFAAEHEVHRGEENRSRFPGEVRDLVRGPRGDPRIRGRRAR